MTTKQEKQQILSDWMDEYSDTSSVKAIIAILFLAIEDNDIADAAHNLLSPLIILCGVVSVCVQNWRKSKLN